MGQLNYHQDIEENVVDFINKFNTKIIINDTLSGLLKNKIASISKPKFSPPSYFYLTDLCNSMKTFVNKKISKIEPTLKQKKAIARGEIIHEFAKRWFQKIEGFESSESLLDGAYIGLPVRGKIDAKISGSIIELKTKHSIPEDFNYVIKNYPNDIEQLGFYTVLDLTKPSVNFLIFLSHENPPKIKAFKIKIKDHNMIKNVLQKRIYDLKKALEKNDPSILGRCRYCNGEECPLKKNETCKWFNNPIKECEILDYIEVSEEKEFIKKFKIAMESWDGMKNRFLIYNILMPRKHYNKNILGIEESFVQEPIGENNKIFIKKLVLELKKDYEPKDFQVPESNIQEIYISKHNWFNYKTAENPDGKMLPFIACVNNGIFYNALSKPSDYKIAELGLTAFLLNMNKGLIFVYYPNLRDLYKVFEIDYSFNDTLKHKITKILDILKSEDTNRLKELPLCKDYAHKNCSFIKSCFG